MAQEREDALADFRSGQARVLVATDVAARGCLGKLGGAKTIRIFQEPMSHFMSHHSILKAPWK